MGANGGMGVPGPSHEQRAAFEFSRAESLRAGKQWRRAERSRAARAGDLGAGKALKRRQEVVELLVQGFGLIFAADENPIALLVLHLDKVVLRRLLPLRRQEEPVPRDGCQGGQHMIAEEPSREHQRPGRGTRSERGSRPARARRARARTAHSTRAKTGGAGRRHAHSVAYGRPRVLHPPPLQPCRAQGETLAAGRGQRLGKGAPCSGSAAPTRCRRPGGGARRPWRRRTGGRRPRWSALSSRLRGRCTPSRSLCVVSKAAKATGPLERQGWRQR